MKLILTDNETKMEYLKKEETFTNDKFMSKKSFLENLFFSYDYKSILYLMKNYKLNIDVCYDILNSLYPIDEEREYNNSKLIKLQKLKKELIEKELLYYNNNFKYYLKRFDTIELNNIFLDKYEQDALDKLSLNVNTVVNDIKDKTIPIYKYNSIEDEITGICISIRKLIDEGIDINNIVLTNVNKDNNYLLEKIFNDFNIPISLNNELSIYNTKMIKDYLEDQDITKVTDIDILTKLTNVLNSLEDINDDSLEYKALLKYLLKNTYLDEVIYKDSIRIKDINSYFPDNYYVFCMSFNNNVIPNYYKDDKYLLDIDKDELSMYYSYEKNDILKEDIINKLKSINNLTLSYHLYDEQEMYISSISNELDLDYKESEISYNYSNNYNKHQLSMMLDDYYNYNVKNEAVEILCSNYDVTYNTYDNSFNGIDIDDYIDYLKEPLIVSFSSLDKYNLCSFAYYVHNVLKLDKYEEKFPIFIGNLFHYILSLEKEENFNFDREWDNYISKRDLSNKEQVLLSFIKDDFKDMLNYIDELMSSTSFVDYNKELELSTVLSKKIEVKFKGVVDKIMIYQNMNDTYYAVIDYKTYDKKLNLNNLVYGMDMQLAIYTYLIGESNLFSNPIFAGMFYQKILSTNKNNNIMNEIKLTGYTTDNINVLEKLDKNYGSSTMIRSLSFKKSSGFGVNSKVLSEDELYNLNKLVKKIINDRTDDILDAKFDINPKKIGNDNVSCEYCEYKDLCFVKEKDFVYLKQQNLTDFLAGGDIDD